MGKPPGLGFSLKDGALGMYVTRSSPVEDAIYDAVEAAQDAGWEPERVVAEMRQAWDWTLREKTERDDSSWAALERGGEG